MVDTLVHNELTIFTKKLMFDRVLNLLLQLYLFWGYPLNTYPKFSEILTFLTPCTCAHQGVSNVSFSENFAYVLIGWPTLGSYYCNSTNTQLKT